MTPSKVMRNFYEDVFLFVLKCIRKRLIFLVCADERFPEYGKVEFVFSYAPEKIRGSVCI